MYTHVNHDHEKIVETVFNFHAVRVCLLKTYSFNDNLLACKHVTHNTVFNLDIIFSGRQHGREHCRNCF